MSPPIEIELIDFKQKTSHQKFPNKENKIEKISENSSRKMLESEPEKSKEKWWEPPRNRTKSGEISTAAPSAPVSEPPTLPASTTMKRKKSSSHSKSSKPKKQKTLAYTPEITESLCLQQNLEFSQSQASECPSHDLSSSIHSPIVTCLSQSVNSPISAKNFQRPEISLAENFKIQITPQNLTDQQVQDLSQDPVLSTPGKTKNQPTKDAMEISEPSSPAKAQKPSPNSAKSKPKSTKTWQVLSPLDLKNSSPPDGQSSNFSPRQSNFEDSYNPPTPTHESHEIDVDQQEQEIIKIETERIHQEKRQKIKNLNPNYVEIHQEREQEEGEILSPVKQPLLPEPGEILEPLEPMSPKEPESDSYNPEQKYYTNLPSNTQNFGTCPFSQKNVTPKSQTCSQSNFQKSEIIDLESESKNRHLIGVYQPYCREKDDGFRCECRLFPNQDLLQNGHWLKYEYQLVNQHRYQVGGILGQGTFGAVYWRGFGEF